MQEKDQRKEKSRKEIEGFLKGYQNEIEQRKIVNKAEREKLVGTNGDKGASWSLVMSNIALKDGNYPGERNVARMRSAILNQHEFLKENDVNVLDSISP